MRTLLATAFVVIGVLGLAAGGAEQEAISAKSLAAIKKATVFIKVESQGASVSGSGFVTKVDGETAYIVTNHHVIEPKLLLTELVPRSLTEPIAQVGGKPGSRPVRPIKIRPASPPLFLTPRMIVLTLKDAKVTAIFGSGTKDELSLPAEALAADPEHDLAVLRVKGLKHPPEPILFSQRADLVETLPVLTFGFPFGKILATGKGNPAMTIGKAAISSLREDDDGELALVQIDGSLNPGNSGGPVVDTQGRLVGVAVATIKNSSGIGLLIPSAEVQKMFLGRVGTCALSAAAAIDGKVPVKIELALIDPLNKMSSVSLHCLPVSKLKDPADPAAKIESLDGVPGAQKLDLVLEKHIATGKLLLNAADSDKELLMQPAYANAEGKTVKGKVFRQSMKVAVANAADPKSAVQPPNAASPLKKDGSWGILFRSIDPSLWNTDTEIESNYAAKLNRASPDIRFLRLKRADTGDMLIVPITYAQLSREPAAEITRSEWCGTAKFGWGGRHLGIAQTSKLALPADKGRVCVLEIPFRGAYAGSGFGHRYFVDDGQACCWNGQEIPRVVFEIAVTTMDLSADEKKVLITSSVGPPARAQSLVAPVCQLVSGSGLAMGADICEDRSLWGD